jgi:hypothetical protein
MRRARRRARAPDTFQPQDSRVEGLGLSVGDLPMPARVVGQAVGQGAEALGGLTRAVGDVVGSRAVADFGANAANNAQGFQDAIGKPRMGTDFNPRGPAPYLAEQLENAGSSLATSYATARAFGARAVIPLLSLQDGAQYYNQARQAGRTPGGVAGAGGAARHLRGPGREVRGAGQGHGRDAGAAHARGAQAGAGERRARS